MKRIVWYGLLFAWLCVACHSRPDYVLDEQQMTTLLTDIHRAEGLLEAQKSQYDEVEQQQAVMAAVLVKHQVTRAQYDSSLIWYSQNLKQLIRVYARVKSNLEQEAEQWENIIAESQLAPLSPEGDSVQLWREDTYLILDPARMTQMHYFEVKADSNFHAADSLDWQFRVRQVSPKQHLVATLAIFYKDSESSTSQTSHIHGDSVLYLGVAADSTQQMERIVTVLNVLDDSVSTAQVPVYVDSITLIRHHRN